jgi:hypothetical protein
MIQRFLIIGLLFIVSNLYGQFPVTGSFYRIDTIHNNTDLSSHNVNNRLIYIEISKDSKSIWYAIFPVDYIVHADTIPDYRIFKILDSDSSMFANSIITKDKKDYFADLKFSRQFDCSGKTIARETIKLEYIDNKLLIVNGKQFKLDIGLKVFQRFTGY